VRIPLVASVVRPSTLRGLGFLIGLLIGFAVALPFLFSIDPTSPDWGLPLVIVPLAALLGWFAAEPAARKGWLSGILAALILTPISLVVVALGVVARSAVAPRSDPNADVGLDLFRDVMLSYPAWLTMFIIVVVWVVAFRGAVRILALH
jgi:hypothetical protein